MSRLKPTLLQAIQQLTQANCPTPRLDAEVLLAHVLQTDRAWLYAHSDDPLPAEVERRFNRLLRRRLRHEPVAYLTGQRDFYGLTFSVTPQVLIPRPETELLVETALGLPGSAGLAVDVGTGSGCIAVALAVYAPSARVIATDISAGALAVARRNALRHGLAGRIQFVQANLLAGLRGPFDLLLANPPYIPQPEMDSLAPDVKQFEPALALTGGGGGLQIAAGILRQAPARLKTGGALLMEIGAGQGPAALKLARLHCPGAQAEIRPDLAGRDRLLVLQF